MMLRKENSTGSLKRISVKITKPTSQLKTPTNYQGCLTQRSCNIVSPSARRVPHSDRKGVVSIDLIQKRKESIEQRADSLKKKVVKMKKKTESADLKSTKEQTRAGNSFCSSERKLQKKQSNCSKEPQLKCFEDINGLELGFSKNNNSERNWDEIIEQRKRELYSQLYKMDKKILGFERDLEQDQIHSKKSMIDMIKRKTGYKQPQMLGIRTNVYKMGKLRQSSKNK